MKNQRNAPRVWANDSVPPDTGGQAALNLMGRNHLQVCRDRNGNGKTKSDFLRERATPYGHFEIKYKMPVNTPPGSYRLNAAAYFSVAARICFKSDLT